MPMEAIPHWQWHQYQNGSCENFQDKSSTNTIACWIIKFVWLLIFENYFVVIK
jgi:hypothetical protein